MTAGHVLPLDAKSEELLAEFNAEVREELALVAKRTLARKGLRQTVEFKLVLSDGRLLEYSVVAPRTRRR